MIAAAPDGVTIAIRVIPRAGTSEIAGSRSGALLVRLNAPPVEGAANEELVRLLSNVLAVPRRAIAIVRGERSRAKVVRVNGLDVATCRARLGLP